MIYLEKYKRFVDELGNVYRYDSLKKEIIKCKLSDGPKGYLIVGTAINNITANITITANNSTKVKPFFFITHLYYINNYILIHFLYQD